jgi:hypothetical protein
VQEGVAPPATGEPREIFEINHNHNHNHNYTRQKVSFGALSDSKLRLEAVEECIFGAKSIQKLYCLTGYAVVAADKQFYNMTEVSCVD